MRVEQIKGKVNSFFRPFFFPSVFSKAKQEMTPGAAEDVGGPGRSASESAKAVKSVVPCGESHIGLRLVSGEEILCCFGQS